MTTSPRAVLTCSKRLSSSSMCAAGSCENAPPRRLPSENAPVIIARAIWELSLSVPAAATWSQVARMSRTSSSTASRSTSVIALVRTTFCFCRLRSEEHTSELQSLAYLVCRLLLEKKKKKYKVHRLKHIKTHTTIDYAMQSDG